MRIHLFFLLLFLPFLSLGDSSVCQGFHDKKCVYVENDKKDQKTHFENLMKIRTKEKENFLCKIPWEIKMDKDRFYLCPELIKKENLKTYQFFYKKLRM